MDDSTYPRGTEPATKAVFPPTKWSLVLAAGNSGSQDAHEALNSLCRAYWFPLYAYSRRRGYSPHDAQDVTQQFFTNLICGDFLDGVGPEKGKFRSFLLASLKNFISNWEKYRNAKKRGGGKLHLSLDAETAEDLYLGGSGTPKSAEEEYNRRWTLQLLERAFAGLYEEYRSEGKGLIFTELKAFLEDSRAVSGEYTSLAQKLQMTPNALAVSVHRLRSRYRELVRTEVALTVAKADDIEDEVRFLFRSLAS